MRRFFAGALLGVVGSLSISLGLIATILIFVVVVALGVSIRSFAAVAGALIGWGLSWLGFFYLSFGMSLCNGPGCGGPPEYLGFVAIGLGIVFLGLLVGLAGLVRSRLRERQTRAA